MDIYQIESTTNVVTKSIKNKKNLTPLVIKSNHQNLLISDDDEEESIPEVSFSADAEFNLNFFEERIPEESSTSVQSDFNTSDLNPSSVASNYDFVQQSSSSTSSSSPPTPSSTSNGSINLVNKTPNKHFINVNLSSGNSQQMVFFFYSYIHS